MRRILVSSVVGLLVTMAFADQADARHRCHRRAHRHHHGCGGYVDNACYVSYGPVQAAHYGPVQAPYHGPVQKGGYHQQAPVQKGYPSPVQKSGYQPAPVQKWQGPQQKGPTQAPPPPAPVQK